MVRHMFYKIKIHILIVLSLFFVLYPTLCSFAGEQEKPLEYKYKTGIYYTVQKGDTLWDLSNKFLDSPWVWPDLWKENNHIHNPHRIYPGQRISFYVQEDPVYVKKTNHVGKKPLEKKEPYYLYSKIDSIGFIKKKPVMPHGSIFNVKEGKEMISHGDLVYIKQMVPMEIGSKYTVYRTIKIKKETRSSEKFQHYLTGVVEITQKQPDVVLAKVVKSFRAIETEDLLIPYKERSPQIILKETRKRIDGKIILSEENESIMGEGSIAFIDKGDKDCVRPGQKFSIYYQEKKKLDKKTNKADILPPVDLGTLLVLHTENSTATVLVTQSEKDIYPGAKICSLLP